MAVWVCADPDPESLKMLEEAGKRLLEGFRLEELGTGLPRRDLRDICYRLLRREKK